LNDGIYELNTNETVTTNKQDIAVSFNNYFLSTVENNLNSITKSNCNPFDYLYQALHGPFPKIKYHATTSTQITNVTKSLKTQYSHGYDEISVRILKTCLPHFLSPLTHICNKLLSSGIFLDCLKYAEIKPLFKSGDRKNPSNYWPVSLLTSFSKIFENIIYTRLVNTL
jgi:Notch-like protein